MFGKLALSAFLLGSALGGATTVHAQSVIHEPLSTWSDRHFLDVGKSCFTDFKPRRRNSTVTPADVRDWPVVRPHWNQVVDIYPTSSLDSLFSRVYRRTANGLDSTGLQPIGITWGRPGAPIVYLAESNSQREHNCITLISASANIDVNLNPANVQLALKSSVESQFTQTAFAYAGTMISPLTAALGQNSTVTEAPDGISLFSVLLAIWEWYRVHPEMIAVGDLQQLEIYNQVQGLALYRLSGLTQGTLLSGEGSATAAIPFFTGGAEASGSGRIRNQTTIEDYSAAIWRVDQMGRLPTASEVSQRAAMLVQFQPDPTNPTFVDSSTAFNISATMVDVPSNYCRTDRWSLIESGANTTASGTFSGLDVRPVSGERSQCRFTARFTPPDAGPGQTVFVLAVKSTLPLISGSERPALVLRTRPVVLSDYRASLSLQPGSGPLDVTILPGGFAPVRVTFPIRESAGRRSRNLQEGSPQVTISCGADPTRSILLEPNAVRWSRNGNSATITLDLKVPDDVISTTGGATSRCSLDGSISLLVENGGQSVPLDLPTFMFNTIRPVQPEQPSAPPGLP